MVTVVVFTSNNARIIYTEDETQFQNERSIVNPDLSKVRGTPPHYWKLENGEILPMSPAERTIRERDHQVNGVDNDVTKFITPTETITFERESKFWEWVEILAPVAVAIFAIGIWYAKHS